MAVAIIVDIEHLRLQRDEKVRECALARFPWAEMERIKRDLVDPLTRFWPTSRKVILLELLYRLVFETYVEGMKEGHKKRVKKWFRLRPFSEQDDFLTAHQQICDRIAQNLMEEFCLFRWLDDWSSESVFILMQELGKQWFLKGRQDGKRRKSTRG
jgi:hypothetical protein